MNPKYCIATSGLYASGLLGDQSVDQHVWEF